jgi:hypothetical protein
MEEDRTLQYQIIFELLLRADFLRGLIFDPEDGGDIT